MKSEPLRYSFYFKSEIHPEWIRWRWKDECDHEANKHKTFKPKISDLKILSEVPKELKTEIRRELYNDIVECEG